ncbi:MAG: ATP-binding protein [Candidatus Lokiarchaeota archaeon]|nr:ATP-binding protein [Candidatus Lokiarchaeota archaeon]
MPDVIFFTALIFAVFVIITGLIRTIVRYFHIKNNKSENIWFIRIFTIFYGICLMILISLIILAILKFQISKITLGNLLYLCGTCFSWVLIVPILKNTRPFISKHQISMEYPSRWKSKGSICLGRVCNKNKTKHQFSLNLDDMAQHIFVCGITGAGKSNFMQNLLLQFSKNHKQIPFLLVEFKGEYQHLQKTIEDLLILKPGVNFSINIFNPERSNPNIHAERVYQIFESGGLLENVDYSPQMERVFIDILRKVVTNKNFRSWNKFQEIAQRYTKNEHNDDITFKKSVVAIENRIRRYSVGTLKHIFDKKSLDVRELFKHKVLLDLSSIIKLGGEKEDALFFLNMILKYLWDWNLEQGSKDYKGIRHVTVIEDAQYFAPQELSSRTKLTSYLEDIALLLRGTGECLITLATRPNLSKEILANCGVLVAFQAHMQKDLMKELLNLREWQVKYLSELKKGQCIVRINSIEKPFALQSSLIKRTWPSDAEIAEKNKIILRKIGMDLSKEKRNSEIESKLETIENKIPVSEQFLNSTGKMEQNKLYYQLCGAILNEESIFCEGCENKLKLEDLVKELYNKQKN